MNKINFFKQQAKNLFKDYNTRVFNENEGFYDYYPRFFSDIEEILYNFKIKDNDFSLMKAQHIIARLSGFYKWNDLIKSSDEALELGRLLLINRLPYQEKQGFFTNLVESIIVEDWQNYEKEYLENVDDATKLDVFKRVFLEEDNIKQTKTSKIRFNFENDEDSQDMIKKIMRAKNISANKAITSSITQKNCVRIMEMGSVEIALSMWGHDDPYAEKERLENPIIDIRLSEEKERLINVVMERENVPFHVAILSFLLFTLESLGYHI